MHYLLCATSLCTKGGKRSRWSRIVAIGYFQAIDVPLFCATKGVKLARRSNDNRRGQLLAYSETSPIPFLFMITALLYVHPQPSVPTLRQDLESVGISVLEIVRDVSKLVQVAARTAPDVLIGDLLAPTDAWFDMLQLLDKVAPCPVVAFTHDLQTKNMVRSVESGIQAYVADGYAAKRLRPLIQLAQARFQFQQQQRKAHEELALRFEERKMVDRAKGILMRAQHISDDDAFRVLRSTAMSSNQRLGQLSHHVIQSAHYAESLNLSGQLRMLSQRIAKLHLLRLALPEDSNFSALMGLACKQVSANLEELRRSLSQATFGDLLEQVELDWGRLHAAISSTNVQAVDAHAEALLTGAERLTSQLEIHGHTPPLHLLNLAGRQRMLSQRYTKFALQCAHPEEFSSEVAGAGMKACQQEFEVVLTHLNSLPIRTSAIHQALEQAGIAWLTLVAAAAEATHVIGTQQGQGSAFGQLSRCSEDLLDLFHQLTAHYEHSLEVLIGR